MEYSQVPPFVGTPNLGLTTSAPVEQGGVQQLPMWMCPPVPYSSTEESLSSPQKKHFKRQQESSINKVSSLSRFTSIFSPKKSSSVKQQRVKGEKGSPPLPRLPASTSGIPTQLRGDESKNNIREQAASLPFKRPESLLLENSSSSYTPGVIAACYYATLTGKGNGPPSKSDSIALPEIDDLPLIALPTGSSVDCPQETRITDSFSFRDSLVQNNSLSFAPRKNVKWHSYVKEHCQPASARGAGSPCRSHTGSEASDKEPQTNRNAAFPRSTITSDGDKEAEPVVSWKRNVLSPDRSHIPTDGSMGYPQPSILQTTRTTVLRSRPNRMTFSSASPPAPKDLRRFSSPVDREKARVSSDFTRALQNNEFGNEYHLHVGSVTSETPSRISPLEEEKISIAMKGSPPRHRHEVRRTASKKQSFRPLGMLNVTNLTEERKETGAPVPKNTSILNKPSFHSSNKSTDGNAVATANRVCIHSPLTPEHRKQSHYEQTSPVMFDWAGDVVNGSSAASFGNSVSTVKLSSKSGSPFRLRTTTRGSARLLARVDSSCNISERENRLSDSSDVNNNTPMSAAICNSSDIV